MVSELKVQNTSVEGHASTNATEIPEMGRPRVQGDNQAIHNSSINIDIESVCYLPQDNSNRISCAVLLRIAFLLNPSEVFSGAHVALTIDSEPKDESLDISEIIPHSEVVSIERRENNDFATRSNVRTLSNEVGVQFSGLSVGSTGERSYNISLDGALLSIKDRPPMAQWIFRDPRGVFYPTQIRVLVVASKIEADTSKLWFPFRISFPADGMRVEVVRKRLFRLSRHTLPTLPGEQNFFIKGNFKPELVRNVYEDGMTSERTATTPAGVGLRAAVVGYKDKLLVTL